MPENNVCKLCGVVLSKENNTVMDQVCDSCVKTRNAEAFALMFGV